MVVVITKVRASEAKTEEPGKHTDEENDEGDDRPSAETLFSGAVNAFAATITAAVVAGV